MRAEIVFRFDDAPTKILLPDAIDDNAGHERVLRIDEPLREVEAIQVGARFCGLGFVQDGRKAGLNWI